jgi:peptide/nickel transport system substrate-binding protein
VSLDGVITARRQDAAPGDACDSESVSERARPAAAKTECVATAMRLALIVAVLGTFFGCARGSDATPETLRTSISVDPPGWNPLVFDNAAVSLYAEFIHGYLLRADDRGRLIPDLAIEVPTVANGGISRDGRTVTYHLRRDARWHDGVPFDARDVVFSFDAAMNPRNAVPDRTGFDHVASVRALDPYTVRVRLTRPFSPFVASCFTMAANDPYPILPAHLLARKPDLNHDPYNAAPVGLGPYKLTSWERGSRIVLTADPHYFRGAPAIPRIEIAVVPNVNTVETLWKTGHLDLAVGRVQAGRTFLDALRARRDAHVVLQPHYEFDFIEFNTTHPPLDDERVRRAIAMGIDRHRMMRDLDGDLWLPGESDRLPGQFAYDPSLTQPPYDPAAAAALLDAAGWHAGRDGLRRKAGRALSLEFVATTESPTTTRVGLFVQQALAKLGVRADLKAYAYNQLWASASEHGILQSGRFDLTYSGWQPNGVDDHSYLFRCDTRPPNGDNFGGICDPVIERAAHEELDAADPALQSAGDRAISRELIARTDLLFLGLNREAVASSTRLEGVEPSVLGEHFWNAWAWRLRSPGT